MPHFDAERRIEADQTRNRLREIQQTIYSQRQPIGNLSICVTGKSKGPERAPKTGWKPFAVLGRWGGFDQTTWFKMKVKVSKSMKGQRVVALVRIAEASFMPGNPGLSEGGESLAYVNGKPFQGLDRNRDELFLVEKAKGGETFDITLEACPSTRFDLYHLFSYADIAVMHPEVWDFYWDCQVVYEICQTLDFETTEARRLAEFLDSTVKSVDLQHKGEPAYFASIAKAKKAFRQGLKAFQTSHGFGRLILSGHSHIDTAWLWPLRETQRKCGRTFSTMLNLMERYPEFHFSCSQPAQYEWIKNQYPELYQRIKQRVKEGRWELCGAPWVEPDCNVPSGESLVRQFLYGNRFFQKEFGKRSRLAWQPDAFGYTWSLPQIMRKAQLDAFVTTKIDWGQFTPFPYSLFQWEGADGTKVLTLMPPLNYNGNPTPKDVLAQWTMFKQKERADELPFAFGWGDGGGGPTMTMIEHGKRLSNITGMPKCEFGRNQDSIDRIAEQCASTDLPVYNGELYLELHRGCQTTQARTKRNNRKCEVMLRDAEFVGSLALLSGGKYDQKGLYEAWKIVMTNQFHDILPGSSITEVYTQADIDYAQAKAYTADARDAALKHLVAKIDTSGGGMPVVVFNTLSWVRSDVAHVRVKLPTGKFLLVDPDGEPVPHQVVGKDEVLFEVDAIPPMGYSVYRIVPGATAAVSRGLLTATETMLENEFLRIRLDKDGRLTSVYDKSEQREALAKGQKGNVLQLFDDRPFCHDAWDIDHNFETSMWEPNPAESVEVVETGPVRAVVRVVRRTEKSVITQDITLYAGQPRVDFVTNVDWWEKRVLLKVAFPVEVRSSRATYEIQFATIERSTHFNTPYDRARFEVAHQRWADLSEGDYGVSILNDSKYGSDVKDNQIRLSLLRSSIDPDPKADEGKHSFTYSIYPHAWSWRNGTIQQGLQLNEPLIAAPASSSRGPLPAVSAFASVDVDNVIIDTVKKAEDSDAIIVRVYEAYGQRGDVKMTFGRKPKKVTECDLMEENDVAVKLAGATVAFSVTPYEIRSFKVSF